MATREELLRQRVNKIYPTGDIAPNLARTPRTVPIQTSGAPLTGPTLPNLARTPAAPIAPPPTAQGSLNFNAPVPPPAAAPPAQGSLNFNVVRPLAGSFTPPPAAPPPAAAPAAPPIAGPTGAELNRGFNAANWGTTAESNIASRFAKVNPALATPAAPPTTGGFFSRLAGGAGPAIAGSLGSAMFAQENPVNVASDKDLMYMAEANPVFYANNKARVDQAIANARAQAGKPEVVTPGVPQRGARLATLSEKPAVDVYGTKDRFDAQKLPSAPAVSATQPVGMAPVATYRDDINAGTSTATRPEGTATMRFGTGAVGAGGPLANARTGQVWAGAATDAEAARNLQARAEQDQATQAEVARLNRATDALRSLREERSPAFRFGVDSIGGGPDKLDVASGRVINRDTPANVVADRMMSAVDTARRFGAGGKAGRLAAKQIGDAYMADKEVQGLEAQLAAKQGTEINPVDMGRFLLDQQKFGWQQGVDKGNLQLREREIQDKIAGRKTEQQFKEGEQQFREREVQNKEAETSLEQQKYLDTQRKAFIDNFTFPDENAPREQIGADIFEMSRVSGIPPETVAAVYAQVVKELKINWAKGGPKNQQALSEEVMKELKRRAMGG